MSYSLKFGTAVIGLLVMAIIASRQLFMFAVLRDARGFLDSPGGKYHLWLAVSAGIAACISGAMMFYFFARRQKVVDSKVLRAPAGMPPTVNSSKRFNDSTPTAFDSLHWARLNPWLSEGQADDRTPMNGAVAESGGSESEQRAFARQSHQIMFKKWSQARHF